MIIFHKKFQVLLWILDAILSVATYSISKFHMFSTLEQDGYEPSYPLPTIMLSETPVPTEEPRVTQPEQADEESSSESEGD